MVRPLQEYFKTVYASDIHDYGMGNLIDFLFERDPRKLEPIDWIITNPPFRLAEQFITTALPLAERGVAMLCRTVFAESRARYLALFRDRPPSDVLIFSGRVPMLRDRLDRKGSSATSYSWFVWGDVGRETRLGWIPPDARSRLERDDDYLSPMLSPVVPRILGDG